MAILSASVYDKKGNVLFSKSYGRSVGGGGIGDDGEVHKVSKCICSGRRARGVYGTWL